MRLPSVSYLFQSFLNAFKRFPLAMAVATIATICGMYMIENENDFDQMVFKLFLSCIVFFPLFIAAVATREANDSSTGGLLVANLVVIGLISTYWYFGAPDSEDFHYTKVVRFFLFAGITHLVVTFLPYLKHGDLDDFWEYNRQLFINFFTGMLYAILIFAGLSFAILAVENLFDLDIDGSIYGHLYAVTVGLFHTTFFLSNFPRQYEYELEPQLFQRGFVNLIKFVFISIVALYFVILYSYGFKILFTWELPKGWVSKLVIGFSVVGILTYLLNYMLPKIEQSGWVKTYRKWFFFVLLPVTGLLFIAIYKRLSDYGFTEERYFVLLTGIWLLGICLYFIFSKKDDIRFIPITLAIGLLVGAVGGPLSAFSVSKKSQKNRLNTILSEIGILKDGKIEQPETLYDGEKARDITSIVKYLFNYNHEEVLSNWIDMSEFDSNTSSYKNVKKTLEIMGIKSVYGFKTQRISNYNFNASESEKIDISDYDSFVRFYLRRENSSKEKEYYLKIEGSKLLFYKTDELLETIEMEGLLKVLKKDFGDKNRQLRVEQMSHFYHGENYGILVSFLNLKFKYENDELKIKSGSGNIFWKKKDK